MNFVKRGIVALIFMFSAPLFSEETSSKEFIEDTSEVKEEGPPILPLNPTEESPPLLPEEQVVEQKASSNQATMLYIEQPVEPEMNNKGSTLKTVAITFGFIAMATIGLLLSSHNTGKRAP